MVQQFGRIFIAFLLILSYQILYASDNKVKIEIEGFNEVKNHKILQENILNTLSLEQQKNHPRLSASRIRRLHKQAPTQIQKALQPFGYYDVKVTPELIPPQKDQTQWLARYVVDLGEPMKFKTVEVSILGDDVEGKIFK